MAAIAVVGYVLFPRRVALAGIVLYAVLVIGLSAVERPMTAN